jgi:hypothetical protein
LIYESACGIPVYKTIEDLTYYEVASITQCLRVLSSQEIWFIGPENFIFYRYVELAEEHGLKIYIKKCHPQYFLDISGYNNLLKSFFL